MIERIVNVINAVFKRIGVLMLAIVGVLLIYWVFCAFWPYTYLRKTYDLGDKYVSLEWVAYSDSLRMVMVSKDGAHHAIIHSPFYGQQMDVIFQKYGADTIFFPGWNGKFPAKKNIVDASGVLIAYSSGYQSGKVSHFGGFDHLYLPEDVNVPSQLGLNGRLRSGYLNMVVRRDDMYDGIDRCPKPNKTRWIWPLKNPLIEKYPFDGKTLRMKSMEMQSRKSKVFRNVSESSIPEDSY